jgi:serine phosphatase RsbU (regulator of sigma subunit)
MVVQPDQGVESAGAALAAFAEVGRALAADAGLPEALAAVARAAAAGAHADVVLVRVAEPDGTALAAVAVAAPAPLAAELVGSRLEAADAPEEALDRLDLAPRAVQRAAERAGAGSLLVLPIRAGGRVVSTLELLRGQSAFREAERHAAEIAAAHAALVLRAFGLADAVDKHGARAVGLDLAGEALVAGSDGTRTADEVARLAVELTDALAAILWLDLGDVLQPVGIHGLAVPAVELDAAQAQAARALADAGAARAVPAEGLPAGLGLSAALPLGQPPLGVLQLLFAADAPPDDARLEPLARFAVRAAHALRASARAQSLALELDRTRALLAVVGQATAQLSLAHTLETAVERVAELLAVDQLAVYLRQDGRLLPAAGRGLAGPHVRVAERLLDLVLGPLRGRGIVQIDEVAADERLADVEEAAAEAGIGPAVAVPLIAAHEVIGLLAVYPAPGRSLTEYDAALLSPLAGQLAVAVQNAQLHERAAQLAEERQEALTAEQEAARRLRALYEISRSFAQSLSLEATLEALATTIVDVLDVDAAVIRMPDERREQLVPRALHIADVNLAEAASAILQRSQPFGASPIQRLFRGGDAFALDETVAMQMGGPHALLVPFLAKGWTGAVVPVSTPAEVIGALSLFSFRPGRPITQTTIDAAVAIAGQAALAIDNARLYQQQKEFSDTMQRSLLPRSEPEVEGLEVGEVYESSARVEVGGDVYDFLELGDGRLAVVLGDVTGHGVEATADMAMAKFVFRSLAREHSEPSDFLAAANDVVAEEIAPGKFITMVYLAVDRARGEVACAGAGHPPPRIVHRDGRVVGLDATGLVLGVDVGQRYEEVRAELPVGSAIVLYTDGVIEARREGELYGVERLDELLSARRELSAAELAHAVVADCRTFAGGELLDDCAVVVIRRTR